MKLDQWVSLGGAFIGAVLGVLLGWALRRWDERAERKRNTAFLALLVSTALRRYVDDLWEVIADIHLHRSSTGHAGKEHYQIPKPPALPDTSDAAWRGMPPKLLTRCLEYPDAVMEGRRTLAFYFDVNGPDSDDCVEQATGLALKALDLSDELRSEFKWPAHQSAFNYRKHLEPREAEYAARREMRQLSD